MNLIPAQKRRVEIAAERFRQVKTLENAILYRDVALEYWENEVIGDESLLNILHEIHDA